MSGPIPINIARIQQQAGKQMAKQAVARQIQSEDRLETSMSRGFNPQAVEREQSRMGKFQTLESRKKAAEAETQRVTEVEAKTEEDLAQSFSRRNPELQKDKLLALRGALKEGATAEEVLEEANKAFKDATLVDEALEYLEQATEGDLKEAVQAALQKHRGEKEREILAGRNVDSAAKAFHKKGVGESPTELRDLYRDITGNPREHNALFNELSSEYDFDDLQMVVSFLLKGLGFDMKSKGPSIQQAELLLLMGEVRSLQSILWVYLYFRSRMGLLRRMYAEYGMTLSDALTFQLLAKKFMKVVEERYPSIMKLLQLGQQMGLDELEMILVFSQFRDAIRQLSPRLYRSMRHRQDLLLVLMETLEELETEEEEEEE